MQGYEYKVVPAPRRGEKARGAKTTAERFAIALMHVMNDLGREGWEYLRADTLPCDERVGLTGTATHFQHMLVFRRALPAVVAEPAAAPAVPVASPPVTQPPVASPPVEAPAVIAPLPPRAAEGAPPAIGPAAPPLPLPSTRPPVRL